MSDLGGHPGTRGTPAREWQTPEPKLEARAGTMLADGLAVRM